MDLKKYYDETSRITNEMKQTREKLDGLIDEYSEIRKICTHDIVFKYKDNYPSQDKIDGNYFCPACKLVIECAEKGQIEQTKFGRARIIPLLNLSLRNGNNVQNAIREEVYSNLDMYYNSKVSTEALSSKMEDAIAEHHFDYLNPNKVLRK